MCVCWQHIAGLYLILHFYTTYCLQEETAIIMFCWRANWDWLAARVTIVEEARSLTISSYPDESFPWCWSYCSILISRETGWFFRRSASGISLSRAFASVTLSRPLRLLIKRTAVLCIFSRESILRSSVGSQRVSAYSITGLQRPTVYFFSGAARIVCLTAPRILLALSTFSNMCLLNLWFCFYPHTHLLYLACNLVTRL